MNKRQATYLDSYLNGRAGYNERIIREAAGAYPRLSEEQILVKALLYPGRPMALSARLRLQEVINAVAA